MQLLYDDRMAGGSVGASRTARPWKYDIGTSKTRATAATNAWSGRMRSPLLNAASKSGRTGTPCSVMARANAFAVHLPPPGWGRSATSALSRDGNGAPGPDVGTGHRSSTGAVTGRSQAPLDVLLDTVQLEIEVNGDHVGPADAADVHRLLSNNQYLWMRFFDYSS